MFSVISTGISSTYQLDKNFHVLDQNNQKQEYCGNEMQQYPSCIFVVVFLNEMNSRNGDSMH